MNNKRNDVFEDYQLYNIISAQIYSNDINNKEAWLEYLESREFGDEVIELYNRMRAKKTFCNDVRKAAKKYSKDFDYMDHMEKSDLESDQEYLEAIGDIEDDITYRICETLSKYRYLSI